MSRKGVYITERDGMAVVKLDSGYNIGVPPASCTLAERPAPVPAKQIEVVQNKSLPTLAIVSTGGTIASRIDYRTGSVTSQFNASDILTAIPGTRGDRQLPHHPACNHPLREHDPGDLAGTCPGSLCRDKGRGKGRHRHARDRHDGLQCSGDQFHDRYPGADRLCRLPAVSRPAFERQCDERGLCSGSSNERSRGSGRRDACDHER